MKRSNRACDDQRVVLVIPDAGPPSNKIVDQSAPGVYGSDWQI